MTTASVQPTDITEATRPVENTTATTAPVLICEQEVVFSTAAAIPVSPAKSTPRWVAAVRGLFATTGEAERRVPQHHPHRYAFLEASCMARAMDRL
jgi:hypothetical protein